MTTLSDYHWLTSDAALPWLALVLEHTGGSGVSTPKLVTELRKSLSPERTHLVLEQVELRQRGREKFTLAERMFFTRKGLEQATDEQLAAYKAARFASGGMIADLCCGMGGDLMAMARRGAAIGVELDPCIAHLAERNCAVNPIDPTSLTVQSIDAAEFPLASVAAWHIDPDRRPSGKRTTRVELHEPPLEALERMLGDNPHAGIKLAPAAEIPPIWQDIAEREWLGSRGECRQQVLWFGNLARWSGQHAATIVSAIGEVRTIVGAPDRDVPAASQIGRYIYEPHAAVLAAHLEGALVAEHQLTAVAARIAYFTADHLLADVALAGFSVSDVLPLDLKRLEAYLKERNVGRLEVKKRGVDVDPEKLRRAVIGTGDGAATLIVCPIENRVQVIVAQRVSASSDLQ